MMKQYIFYLPFYICVTPFISFWLFFGHQYIWSPIWMCIDVEVSRFS